MISFELNLKLEKELKKLEASLIEKYDEIKHLKLEERKYIEKQALISNVGASTRIENAVLTDIEVEWVDTTLTKDGKNSTRTLTTRRFNKNSNVRFNSLV